MTWGEFKKAVEDLGVKDEFELRYIDWPSFGEVEVDISEDGVIIE